MTSRPIPIPIAPPPKEQSLLKIIAELDYLRYECCCSLEKLQIALDHLKAIKASADAESFK